MTLSSWKKVLIGVGALFGLLIAALVVTPFLVDPESLKARIADQVKKATGRDLLIDGSVSLALFPIPSVHVTQVRMLNATGAADVPLAEVKSFTLVPSLLSLLGGNLEMAEVKLAEPKVALEIDSTGKWNWNFTPLSGQSVPSARKTSSPASISLGKLTIENGTLTFTDHKRGRSINAHKLAAVALIGTLEGPYALTGRAVVNDAPVEIDLAIGAPSGEDRPASLALAAGGGRIIFKGTARELGSDARIAGRASVSAGSLSGFVACLAHLAGRAPPTMPALLASEFTFDGEIEASQTRFGAHDFKMALAKDTGSGSVTVTLRPELALHGRIVLPKVDLDRALAELATVAKPAGPATSASSEGVSLLQTATAKVSLEAGEVLYNKQPIRNVAIELDAKDGMVAVPKLAALLPGDMLLQARSTLSGGSGRPTVAGEFSLVGNNLRETLAWLGIDVSDAPTDRLKRLSLKGRLGSTGGNVQVNDVAFDFDDVRGTGALSATFSVPLSLALRLEVIDTIDLDSFVVPGDGQKKRTARASAATVNKPAGIGPSLQMRLKINRAIYNKETIGGVDIDFATKGRTLELKDVKVSNLAGGRIAVRGRVEEYDTALSQADLAFNFEAPDMARVLRAAGATAPSELGQVTASGRVSGNIEALTFRALRVAAQGQTAEVDGTLTMPGAALGPPSSIGYKGKVTAVGQTLEGTIDAKLAARPTIVADLRTTLLDLDQLGTPAPVSRAPSRGARPAAPTAAVPALDIWPLRSFDGSFKLSAATVVSAPFRLSDAAVAATLADGVLTLQHLRAGLHGGRLDLSGTVDATRPVLSFELKGDATDLHIGDMLRSLSGSNQYGGPVKVTVDGRMSATGIALRGQGMTSQQIKGSMAGGAQLGGHVQVGADKSLTALGTAAAGAIGGVIDNTLGSALGIAGIKGGTGIGNLLNAASLLLNRFVNRANPISGRIDIAGGILSDRSLIVSGNGATANISTRTNLAASATDTTVNFTIVEDGSAPYLIATVKGPFSNLSYNAVRGSAKDPPGMVNTLTAIPNAIPNIIPGMGGGQRSPLNIPIPNIFGR